jgi:hypothetical protein
LRAVKAYAGTICSFAGTAGENLPLFPGQLNVKTHRIPDCSPEDPGLFAENRETAGLHPHCQNLMFDLGSLDAFYFLESVLDDKRYGSAATAYLSYFFEHCLYPVSGYIPWGEHAGYDLVERTIRKGAYKGAHEVKLHIVPWDYFWKISKNAVRHEITAAFRNHICDEKTFAFNRHANMDGTPNTGSSPCSLMDSGGLYLHAWAWLYKKEGDAKLLEWVKRMHNHAMGRTSGTTGLFNTAEDRPHELWYLDVLSYAALVLGASEILGNEGTVYSRDALSLIEAYYNTAYNGKKKGFYDTINISTGKPVIGLSPHCPNSEKSNPDYIKAYTRPEWLGAWDNIENSNKIVTIAVTSAAAFYYSRDQGALKLFDAAIEPLEIEKHTAAGKALASGDMAAVILGLCHTYKITGEEKYLASAAKLVEHGLRNNYQNDLFTTGKHTLKEYYCTRYGSGDLASAFLAFWIACNRRDVPLPPIRNLCGTFSIE